MPTIIVKAAPDRDLYIAWSTVVECPASWGTRTEMLAWVVQDWRRRQGNATPDPVSEPATRFDRADATGTSAAYSFAWFGSWDYAGFVYRQQGVLPRARLADAVEALERGDEPAVWDLLEPFEDRGEVCRG